MNNNYGQMQNPYWGSSFSQKNLIQPVGQVFISNDSNELPNIPIVGNMSVIISSNDGLIHIKTIQNGAPLTSTYTIVPYVDPKTQLEETLQQCMQRIATLEEELKGKKENDKTKF